MLREFSLRSGWLGLAAVALLSWPLFAAEGREGANEAAGPEAGWETIFDGKTLEGWDGNPAFWSVKDGTITGQTTAENPTKGNTFIIWRNGELGDFELKLEYRIVNGNSGIQYRSFEVPDEKWVIGGYQADFEAGDTYSGILYGERYRGILCNRGQKTVIKEDHKPETVGTVGDSKEIQTKIKKEDWNEYHVTAQGFHFVHRINGVVTADCTDEDKEMRREKGLLALQLHAGPPMTVQFRNIKLKRLDAKEKVGQNERKRVAFIAGVRSHGFAAHEHNAGCLLLADALKKGMPNIDAVVYSGGWPKDPNALDGFDCIVMYSDGGGGHMVNRNLDQVEKLVKEGVGIVCIHYAVEVPKGKEGDTFLRWIGGYFEPNWSVNPHWTANFTKFPNHPISRGLQPFSVNDEWYFHMRFQPEMKGVTPILTDIPPESTMQRGDGPHSGNPDVRKAVANKEPQHVAWAYQREDGGRGFGFTGGHNHFGWGNNNFRRTMLNAIVWCAHGEVPEGGVPVQNLTAEDLLKNQDKDRPSDFSVENLQKQLDEWNKAAAAAVQ